MEDDILVDSVLPHGTPVTWEGRGGVEMVGTVLTYLEHLEMFLVEDEDGNKAEKALEDLTVIE